MSYGRGHETGTRHQRPRHLPAWAQAQYEERIRILEQEEAAYLADAAQQIEEELQTWQRYEEEQRHE